MTASTPEPVVGDPDLSNNTASVRFVAVGADVSVAVSEPPSGPVGLNERVRFEVEVANGGPTDLGGIESLIEVSGGRIVGLGFTDFFGCSASGDRRSVSCAREAAVPAGFSTTVNVRVQATSAGPVTLTASTPEPVVGDPDLSNNTATAQYEVVNAPPVATNDSYVVDEDGVLVVGAPGLLANDSDPDGDPLAVVLGTSANGTVTPGTAGAGSFRYEPDPDFVGTDTFVYRVEDGNGGADLARVTIVVRAAAEIRDDLIDDVVNLDSVPPIVRFILLVPLSGTTPAQQLAGLDVFDLFVGILRFFEVLDATTADGLLETAAALRTALG